VEKLGTYVETTSGSSSASSDLVAASDIIRAEVQVDKERTQSETVRYNARQVFTAPVGAADDGLNCAVNVKACAGDDGSALHQYGYAGPTIFRTLDPLIGRWFYYLADGTPANQDSAVVAHEACMDDGAADPQACHVDEVGGYGAWLKATALRLPNLTKEQWAGVIVGTIVVVIVCNAVCADLYLAAGGALAAGDATTFVAMGGMEAAVAVGVPAYGTVTTVWRIVDPNSPLDPGLLDALQYSDGTGGASTPVTQELVPSFMHQWRYPDGTWGSNANWGN
jgi:hypothetical protein